MPQNASCAYKIHPSKSKLHIIIQQPHLLPRFERRQSDIRTPIAAESVAERTIPARPDLALHSEIQLVQVARRQLREVGVGLRTRGGVFGLDALGQAAGAVFAGSAAFGVGFAGFG